MKRMQVLLALLALLLLGFSVASRAEDTDIYVDNAANNGPPNILFVIYNGANMDAASGSSCTYPDGTPPSTGNTKTSGLLQCALVNAISSLKDGAVNVGIVVNNASSFDGQTQLTTDTTKGGYHDLCNSSGNGGCVIRRLMNMDAAGKASMTAFIKGLQQPNGGSTSVNGVNLKVNTNSSDPAAAMQEAWAYYNGKVGGSGTDYSIPPPGSATNTAGSILQRGCQRNFIVYIGNSQKGVPTNAGDAGITATQVGAPASLLTQITGGIAFNPPACGSTAAYTLAAGNDWADEWTRLMYTVDGGSSTQNGSVQNIVTYTVNINADACVIDSVGMMASMAKNGGGKFFDTSSATDLTIAIGEILNEVQAVNSVFSSASLPVSVNAQGTYLNQIFLGMFRPDASANPRWMGNLKQYQFIRNSTGDLVLGDARGQAAISSANTGFISPNAISYWTYKSDGSPGNLPVAAPDDSTTGGFFVNDLKGATPTAFDLADGEVVEKGGVAQQLRKDSLKATFAGAMAAGTNPRRLYTYCPTGASCNYDLTNTANEFSTANSGIASNAFGVDNSVGIVSIVRSGTAALVTTSGNHGFTVGQTVTIRNTNQAAYNKSYTLVSGDVPSTTTFWIRNLPAETPTTPATGTYVLTKAGASQFNVSTAADAISRVASTNSASASDVVTVKTATAHTFNIGDTVQFSNAIVGYPSPVQVTGYAADRMSFTFNLPLSPATGLYDGSASYQSSAATIVSSASSVVTSGSGNSAVNTITVTTTSHPFHDGQSVTLSGFKGSWVNATYSITRIDSSKFSFQWTGNITNNDLSAAAQSTRAASIVSAAQAVKMQRTTDAAKATITVTGATPNFFAGGDTVTLSSTTPGFTPASGTAPISCTSPCTTFTYTVPLADTPAAVPAGTTVGIGAGAVTAISLSHDAAGLVTVRAPTNTFVNGDMINIAASGGPYPSETEYLGAKKITCGTDCTTFTYGPITINPVSPATGANMQAYSGTASPDRDTVIKWVRGMDNQGDEKGPGNGVTVRESIHGDVLHSRPLVINYGDDRGIVAFYGANDGVFRAVNGKQSGNIGTVPAGGELWGLVLPEHYPYLNRLRTNAPELRFPATLLATAQPKNYFVDGPTGVFQKLADNGTIDKAYIYVTMRRGGRMMYALDVSQPQSPRVMWNGPISNATTGFEELGQTWSRPRLTILQNYANPVLIFGGGYDPGQDAQPPTTATMGRAIYIVDAVSGALVWSAAPGCTTSATCKQTPAMTHPIASDVAFVDRNNDGKTDKLYVGDLGGNLWRFDVSSADTSTWSATKVASLGCDDGSSPAPLCPIQTGDTVARAPRKFFFPPSVLSIKGAGATGSYDALSLASGDREHPLKDTTSSSSYYVTDRFFMLKDTGTSLGTPVTTNLNMTNLFNATSTAWYNQLSGFYITFAAGEKAVNAPLAVNGTIFFSTNKPTPDATCSANLGQAKAYGVDPFTGVAVNNILQGGGMPPSAVAGIVQITTGSGASATTTNEKFCIGCGISGSQLGGTNTATCNSALENCNAGKVIPKNLRRTYWYKK